MTRPRPPKPKPYLFTRWLFSKELLRPWLAHFNHHNVPAGIVSRRRPPAFAVWRHGVEATGDHTFKSECISEDMRVEESVHGFEEIFNTKKEEVIGGKPKRREAGRRQEEAHP